MSNEVTTAARPRLLTVPEVARELGVKPQKVRGFIARGDLAAVDMADSPLSRPCLKVRPEDLAAFLESRKICKTLPTRRRPRLQGIPDYFGE
jgi:hypothetical protein